MNIMWQWKPLSTFLASWSGCLLFIISTGCYNELYHVKPQAIYNGEDMGLKQDDKEVDLEPCLGQKPPQKCET